MELSRSCQLSQGTTGKCAMLEEHFLAKTYNRSAKGHPKQASLCLYSSWAGVLPSSAFHPSAPGQCLLKALGWPVASLMVELRVGMLVAIHFSPLRGSPPTQYRTEQGWRGTEVRDSHLNVPNMLPSLSLPCPPRLMLYFGHVFSKLALTQRRGKRKSSGGGSRTLETWG